MKILTAINEVIDQLLEAPSADSVLARSLQPCADTGAHLAVMASRVPLRPKGPAPRGPVLAGLNGTQDLGIGAFWAQSSFFLPAE